MATIINADTSNGLKLTSDTSGEIQLQSAGTTAVTIDTSQRAAFVAGTAALPAITTTGDTNTGMFFPAADTIAFAEGGAEAMRIDSSGNVGIGTASPTSKLQVNGASLLGSPATFYVGDDGGSLGAFLNQTAALPIRFNTNSSERMRIASDGKVLYGFTSSQSGGQWQHYTPANNYNIQFFNEYASGTGYFLEFIRSVSGSYNAVGTITASTTTTSYGTSSDYRLKENVVPMSGSIDRLKQLKPSTWSWVQDGSHGEGFLAHEAQEVVPEAVVGTKDAIKTEEYEVTPAVLGDEDNVVTEAVMGTREVPDYQGIDQSKLVPLLTAALQEAITKIEDLETRIQALENA